MNSVKRVVLALGLISLGAISQVAKACSVAGCSTSSCNSTDCGDSCCYGGYFTNKSYFSDKINAFGSATFLRDALFRIDAATAREDGFGGALQVVPFGGSTTDHGSKELARWFGYNHKGVCGNPIVFGEATSTVDPLVSSLALVDGIDLDCRHFNIRTTGDAFKSSVTFNPRQKFFGIGLNWKQVLFFNDDCTRRWWFEVSAPIVHVENDMRMCESPAADSSKDAYTDVKGLDDAAYVTSVAAAFSQASWKYGKILACGTAANSNTGSCATNCSTACSSSCCDMKKTRIADIELKLGYNQSLTDCASLDTYLGAVLPTGNKAKGEYVFEAIVGNGKHWGVMLGAELGFKLTHSDAGSLKWFAAADLRYLFHNEQVRSFDLVGRPWSRYQTMYASKEKMEAALAGDAGKRDQFATSGINLMTRCVTVHPRCQFTADTSFMWEGKHLLAEVGYGFYARQAERIDPNWNIAPVLASRSESALAGGVAPWRLMGDNVSDDGVTVFQDPARALLLYEKYKISVCDVDWSSAAHPAVMNNSVYASLGYKWGDVCYPTMLSLGAGWDFAFSNTAMHKWTLFGKLGVSF